MFMYFDDLYLVSFNKRVIWILVELDVSEGLLTAFDRVGDYSRGKFFQSMVGLMEGLVEMFVMSSTRSP